MVDQSEAFFLIIHGTTLNVSYFAKSQEKGIRYCNNRITLANRCYYGLNRQLSSRNISRTAKLILYKMLTLAVLLYSAEAWILLSTDAAALRVFERKVLRKIFGTVRVGDDFCIRFNSELYKLLNDIDVVHT